MSDSERCGCGFWTLKPGQDAHNEQRRYGVVTHRRALPCISTPAVPESDQILWPWEARALAAEAEVEALREELRSRVCDACTGKGTS